MMNREDLVKVFKALAILRSIKNKRRYDRLVRTIENLRDEIKVNTPVMYKDCNNVLRIGTMDYENTYNIDKYYCKSVLEAMRHKDSNYLRLKDCYIFNDGKYYSRDDYFESNGKIYSKKEYRLTKDNEIINLKDSILIQTDGRNNSIEYIKSDCELIDVNDIETEMGNLIYDRPTISIRPSANYITILDTALFSLIKYKGKRIVSRNTSNYRSTMRIPLEKVKDFSIDINFAEFWEAAKTRIKKTLEEGWSSTNNPSSLNYTINMHNFTSSVKNRVIANKLKNHLTYSYLEISKLFDLLKELQELEA